MQHKKDGAEIESDVPEVCARGGGFGGKYEEKVGVSESCGKCIECETYVF